MHELFLRKFKAAVNDKISEARVQLTLQDGFLPIVVSSTLSGVQVAEIDLEETPKGEAVNLLRKYVTSPDVEGLALIFLADTVSVKTEKVNEVPEDFSKEPGATEAIMVHLYTKEGVEYRRIPYLRKADNDYWFGDDGWKKPETMTGLLSNPFQI